VLYFTGIPNMIGVSLLVGLLVINPIALGFGMLIQSLWLCQCIESLHFKNENPVIYRLLQAMGKVIIVPFMLLILSSLVVAAIFSQGNQFAFIMLGFFCKVQLTGFLLEILLAILAFKVCQPLTYLLTHPPTKTLTYSLYLLNNSRIISTSTCDSFCA
jgi:hypothetical protein